MKADIGVPLVGDVDFRGDCPKEGAEHITLVSWVRKHYPDTLGAVLIHPRNEGKRSYQKAARYAVEGLTKGASDFVIPCTPPICIELKRKDRTLSDITPEQVEYIRTVNRMGGYACVALGWEAAAEFIQECVEKGLTL